MATLSRQPFAPLDGARLKSLTSLKNRQNALPSSPGKRKVADAQNDDDFENVDPLSSKRSKGSNLEGSLNKTFFKPSTFVMTKAVSTSSITSSFVPPTKPRSRTILQPKSPAARLNSFPTQPSTPLTAPAGRSPTRGTKRIGILSRHRRHAQRIDPPAFGLGSSSSAPFSLDAALKGSIPTYSGSLSLAPSSSTFQVGSEMQSSWFFDIHEDTPEQEMTNLLQHHTGTLDISSDEESERRVMRERAEGRDKENIPPADDVSQTSSRARVPDENEMMGIEKQRGPLAEMDARDYYAEGCDEDSVVLVPGDEDDEPQQPHSDQVVAVAVAVAQQGDEYAQEQQVFAEPQEPVVSIADVESVNVDVLMGSNASKPAAVLEPIEGTGESFELWESTSAKDEGDAPASPGLVPELVEDAENSAPAADVVL